MILDGRYGAMFVSKSQLFLQSSVYLYIDVGLHVYGFLQESLKSTSCCFHFRLPSKFSRMLEKSNKPRWISLSRFVLLLTITAGNWLIRDCLSRDCLSKNI